MADLLDPIDSWPGDDATHIVRFNPDYVGLLTSLCARLLPRQFWDGDYATQDTMNDKIEELMLLLSTPYDCPDCPPGGGMDLIESQLLLANANLVTFDDIPDTYRDLVLRVRIRMTTTTQRYLQAKLNGDAGSHYSSLFFNPNQTSNFNTAYWRFGYLTFSSAPADFFGQFEITLPDYTAAAEKQAFWRGSSINGNAHTALVGVYGNGAWYDTNPVSQIDLFPNGDNFAAGSSFDLYGVS